MTGSDDEVVLEFIWQGFGVYTWQKRVITLALLQELMSLWPFSSVWFLKVLALKENSLFWTKWPKQQITSHVPKVPKPFFFFVFLIHTHAYGHQKAATLVRDPYPHIYSVSGLCFTRPRGR